MATTTATTSSPFDKTPTLRDAVTPRQERRERERKASSLGRERASARCPWIRKRLPLDLHPSRQARKRQRGRKRGREGGREASKEMTDSSDGGPPARAAPRVHREIATSQSTSVRRMASFPPFSHQIGFIFGKRGDEGRAMAVGRADADVSETKRKRGRRDAACRRGNLFHGPRPLPLRN